MIYPIGKEIVFNNKLGVITGARLQGTHLQYETNLGWLSAMSVHLQNKTDLAQIIPCAIRLRPLPKEALN